ncbi:MAG TPA: selenium metabolism-associated LysR family transcriptional regulator [Syntrophales bacterium]|nr:selenium metabolism-associated LysR family transcriptional regulator [Syntrophales bacterium]
MDTNINLNQLRVFHVTAKSQSFTRAAEALFLTQPGVSKHIKELENYYGTRLFDRLGKKVVLTRAGEILYGKTEVIFNMIDQLKIEIDELQGLNRGVLNIGASVTIGIYILPKLLGQFRSTYPHIHIGLDIVLNQQVVEMVLNNSIDFGFLGAPAHDDRLIMEPFYKDELVLIVPSSHEWAGYGAIEPHELSACPFIMSRRGSGTRTVIEEILGRKGVTLKNVMEMGNTEAVKKAVEEGLGMSIVSKITVSREEHLGVIKTLRISGVDLERTLYFIYRKDKYLSNLDKTFLQFIVYNKT